MLVWYERFVQKVVLGKRPVVVLKEKYLSSLPMSESFIKTYDAE